MQRGSKDAAAGGEEITGSNNIELKKKDFVVVQPNVTTLHSVLISTVYPTGTEVFKRPQTGRKESGQLVCQTGVHQRNPGQNSPVTD